MADTRNPDVIEDEVATSNSIAQEIKFRQQQQYQQDSVDTYKDISSATLSPHPKMEENGVVDENGIHHNSKYEELLRQQLQHKESLDASLESELVMSQKSDHSLNSLGSKRLTPVGDVEKATFQDGYSSLPLGGGAGFDADNMGRSSTRRSGSASDYDVERCSVKSELGSSRHSLVDTPMTGDLSGLPKSPKSPSRVGSDHSGGFGSGRRTPQREFYGDDSLGDVRQSPVRSAEGSARQSPFAGRPGSGSRSRTPVDTRIDDVLGSPGSRSSPVRQTPAREPISDVLGSDAITSLSQSQASGSALQTLDRDASVAGSAHSSTRGTPQKETLSASLRGSQERLYGSQELFPPTGDRSQVGSVSSTRHSSRAHSLSSLTSEQELSQFLDHNTSRNSSDVGRTPLNFNTHPDESATLPPIMRDRDRPASLPLYTTQSPAGVDKRSYTPDHKTWGTQATTGGGGDFGMSRDLAGKLVPRSASSSRASSRTVTPVNVSGQESQKVRELEDTIATLRKLLGSREQEVHELTTQLRDLKDINQSLKRDVEHARSRRTPTGPEELERQHQQLLKEKEILAAEVVKLRDRLETTRGSKVDSFSASSSTSQQRRIDELEAHIRNLREASDTTCQKLTRSELRIKELLDENDKLRSTTSVRVQDLHDDKGGRHGDRQHQIEIQQLKEDVRALRDRNYTLQDENFKLREGKEPMRSPDVRSSVLRDPYSERARLTSSIRSDDGILQRTPMEPSSLRDMNPRTSDHITSQSRSQVLVSPRQNGARRSLDRSYGSDNFPLPAARDPQPQFSADHDPRDGKDYFSRSRLENAVVDKRNRSLPVTEK